MDIQAALSTIATATELAKLIMSSKIDDKVKAQASELKDIIFSLQRTIFSIQSENHELLESKRIIKDQLAEITNWNDTVRKYKLDEVSAGLFLFSLKEEYCQTEPFHNICPNCYSNKKWSILTKIQARGFNPDYICKNPDCNATYAV